MTIGVVVGGLVLIAVLVRAWRSYAAFRRRFVPILLYHALTDDPRERHDNIVHQPEFERQMRWLVRHGYKPVAGSALALNGQTHGERLVAITFDDGHSSNYRLGLPIIRELGLRCTIFLSTDYVGREAEFPWPYAKNDPPLSWHEVREMQQVGVEFGSHGCSHRRFPELDDCELERELQESRQIIHQATGTEPSIFAYPYGAFDERVKDAVIRAGYKAAYAVNAGPDFSDRFAIPRIVIRNQTSLLGFRFRIWGLHSYLKTRAWFRWLRPVLRMWRLAYF